MLYKQTSVNVFYELDEIEFLFSAFQKFLSLSLIFLFFAIVDQSCKLQNSFMVSKPQSMASTTPTEIAQSTHTTPIHTTPTPSTSTQSPLLLLSNMSNLMSIKLDYTNYIPLKHQLITILEVYSLVEHIDGTAPKPSPFVLDATEMQLQLLILNFKLGRSRIRHYFP